MKNKIQEFIKEIENQHKENDAFLGFYIYGGGIDESCIKANKEGLRLYAIELLKASLKCYLEEEKTHDIYLDWEDENADFSPNFIELIKEKKNEITTKIEKISFKDKLFSFGCGTIMILIIVVFLIGIGTVFSWL